MKNLFIGMLGIAVLMASQNTTATATPEQAQHASTGLEIEKQHSQPQ